MWGSEKWILLERLFHGLPCSKLLGLKPASEDQRGPKANLLPCDVEDLGKKTQITQDSKWQGEQKMKYNVQMQRIN